MKMRRAFLMMALVLALGLVASVASADQVDSFAMTFQSGATFAGMVTFAPGFTN